MRLRVHIISTNKLFAQVIDQVMSTGIIPEHAPPKVSHPIWKT